MKKAVVLLSGGLDSTTTLYEALAQSREVIALSFNYQQRHDIELESARRIAEVAGIKEHVILPVDFSLIGSSALTADIPVPKGGEDLGRENFIPSTYVPARNLIFLSLATALAESRGAGEVYIGVNALDYSGYPDCRDDFITSFEQTAALATKTGREGNKIEVKTPLIRLSKAEIVRRALDLEVPLEHTWSCYDPQEKDGRLVPCGECDSCLLRAKGFAEAATADPALPEG